MFQVPPKRKDADYEHLCYFGHLTQHAASIGATELAVFAVGPRRLLFGRTGLTGLMHVRPGDSTPETRLAAIRAFEAIVGPCVASGQDGIVQVEAARHARLPQFCLVILGRRAARVIGAAAFIARFTDQAEATRAMEYLRGESQ